MAFIKTITIDDFYTKSQATELYQIASGLQYVQGEISSEVENFNHVPADIDNIFSSVLGRKMKVDVDRSGVFRYTEPFVHFEDFKSTDEWIFIVALENTMFNLYEHTSGARNALENHVFSYRNFLEWNLRVNYELEPGHGIFFRPWLFHSFTRSLVQLFRLRET